MDSDKNLEEQLKMYQDVAKEHKDVDIAGLMLAALEKQDANKVSPKAKRWAYLISIGAPPFGLFFAFKYYFSSESDAKSVANACVMLTIVAVVGFLLFVKILFSSSGVSTQQIEQIKPKDIYQLSQ